MLSPLSSSSLASDVDTSKALTSKVGQQPSGEFSFIGTLHPERARVLLLSNIHSPVTIVEETSDARGFGWSYSNVGLEGLGKWLREVLKGQSRTTKWVPSVERCWVFLAVLEGAVTEELSIDTTITRIVDVLSSCVSMIENINGWRQYSLRARSHIDGHL